MQSIVSKQMAELGTFGKILVGWHTIPGCLPRTVPAAPDLALTVQSDCIYQ